MSFALLVSLLGGFDGMRKARSPQFDVASRVVKRAACLAVIRPGMPGREAEKLSGQPDIYAMIGRTGHAIYDGPGGVSLVYAWESCKVAGEKEPHLRWVVKEVGLMPPPTSPASR